MDRGSSDFNNLLASWGCRIDKISRGIDAGIVRLIIERISDTQATQLAQTMRNAEIDWLELPNNRLSESGVRALGEMLPHTKINYLSLRNSGLDHKHIGPVLKSLQETSITDLDLSGNCICECEELVQALSRGPVRVLHLQRNLVDTKNARLLLPLLKENRLAHLFVEGNQFSDELLYDFSIAGPRRGRVLGGDKPVDSWVENALDRKPGKQHVKL